MCGIFGFIGSENTKHLKKMGELIQHRGPDGEGYHVDSWFSVGNRRLSIVDPAGGRQPIYNETESVVVVANCEIYNFKALKFELEKKGHKFSTNCDTEVIVHGYEEFGLELFSKLEGCFSIAITDTENKRMILARDRYGINPLFYKSNSSSMSFASEMKSLMFDSKNSLDSFALNDYFTFMYVPGRSTLVSGINKIKPGEYAVFNLSRDMKKLSLEFTTYWSVDVREGNLSLNASVTKFKNLLQESVHSRMMSDVPIGLSLSGGIDSSAVAHYMSEFSDEQIKTYSIVIDEEDQANTLNMVSELDTDHHEMEIQLDNLNLLPEIVYHNDFLIGDPTNVPTYMISSLASKKVKVLLTGSAADDLLGGYGVFKINMKSEFNPLHSRPEKRHMRYVSYLRDDFTTGEKEELLGPIDYNPYKKLEKYFNSNETYFTQLSSVLQNTYLPNNLLTKVNSMMMANSVEGRVPFLNLNLVEFINKEVPSKYKIRNGVEKWLFRKSMKDILPEQNRKMVKKPFSVPIEKLFNFDYQNETHNLLSECDVYHDKVLNQKFVTKILDSNRKNSDYSRQTWALACFSHWYKRFIF